MPVTRSTHGAPVRTIWLGMRCAFTQAALEGALATPGAIVPAAVVLPRGPKPASAGWPDPPFDRWLRERNIAIIEIDRLAGRGLKAILALVEEWGIEVGVGACLPWKVPARLRAAIAGGVLNIHPSLLPALRSPEPVFHAYRQGLETTGITVHLMDDGWDSGPILAQEPAAIPEDARADAFETDLARRGGEMLAAAARPWRDGIIQPRPQDDTRATWAPVPAAADRHMPETLTVARAARFLAACGPLTATDADTGETVAVSRLAGPDEPVARVRCQDGDLWLRRTGTNEAGTGAGRV